LIGGGEGGGEFSIYRRLSQCIDGAIGTINMLVIYSTLNNYIGKDGIPYARDS
jgi:hypothetical protein